MANSNRKKQYNANKLAKVGDEIVCPICGTQKVIDIKTKTIIIIIIPNIPKDLKELEFSRRTWKKKKCILQCVKTQF